MKHDTYLRDFFKSPVRFADLMNGTIFNGKRILDNEKISLDDSNVGSVVDGILIDRQRDVIMKSMENQMFH